MMKKRNGAVEAREGERERERKRKILMTVEFMFHAKYIYNDLLRRYFLSIKYNAIRYAIAFSFLFAVIACFLSFMHTHQVSTAIMSVCVCAYFFSPSLFIKYKCIAYRNFHFYWRRIKCLYYIMVHSFIFESVVVLFFILFSVFLYVSIIIVFASCD